MAFLGRAGMRTYVEWDGPDDRPVLVLSNSLGADLSLWEPQVPELSRRFRMLRYDTRGHGKSAAPPGPYSIELLSRDVLGMLDELGIEDFCFCGLSMGGMIGQWLGVHAADRVRKLVLANTAAQIGTAEVWNARIRTVLEEGVEAVIPGVLERWFTSDFRERHPEAVAKTRKMLDSTSREGYAAACAAVRDMDERESIHTIHIPTLVIAGSQDPVTPPQDGRFLAATIRGAHYVELTAAHLSNVEAAGAFTAAVLDFLG